MPTPQNVPDESLDDLIPGRVSYEVRYTTYIPAENSQAFRPITRLLCLQCNTEMDQHEPDCPTLGNKWLDMNNKEPQALMQLMAELNKVINWQQCNTPGSLAIGVHGEGLTRLGLNEQDMVNLIRFSRRCEKGHFRVPDRDCLICEPPQPSYPYNDYDGWDRLFDTRYE